MPPRRARALLLAALSASQAAAARIRSIPRHSSGSLSYADFYALGPHSDRPMILTDVPPAESPCLGGLQAEPAALLEAMLQHCGGQLRLDVMAGESVRGGKRSLTTMDFKEFIRLWPHGGVSASLGHEGPLLGLEYPLMERCSQRLWELVRIPPYFSGDAGLRAKAAGVRYGENPGYPAVTFSDAGFLTLSHIDWPNNEIWIAMCFGRKAARTISISSIAEHWDRGAQLSRFASGKRAQGLVLNPHFHRSFDLFDEAFVEEELPGVEIWEGDLAGGEILYLPTSALHCVRTEERSVYVIADFVDLNSLLAPNPRQLPLKLDSCAQRCHLANFTEEHAGPTICRKSPYCNELVSWLLDEDVRFPLLDASGPARNSTERPVGAALLWEVASSGAALLRGRRAAAWRPPWQGR